MSSIDTQELPAEPTVDEKNDAFLKQAECENPTWTCWKSNCDCEVLWIHRVPGNRDNSKDDPYSKRNNWKCWKCDPPLSPSFVGDRRGPLGLLPKIEEEAELDRMGPDADAKATSEQRVNETVDDPHRLARMNLELYRASFGREVKYWNESWYLWKAGQYIEVTHDHFVARLNQSIKQEFDRAWASENTEYESWKKSERYDESKDKGTPTAKKVTSSLVRNVVEATRAMCFVSSRTRMHSWIGERNDGDTYVSVENGMLNLSKRLAGEKSSEAILSPHESAWFSTSKLPYKYDTEAVCPFWVQFLEDVFNGDEESILALQMWFGYLLTPDMSLHKVMFIIGPTRSGKGTIISVLRELLGHETIATPTLSSLGQNFGLASLVGKTAAIIADARMPSKADESIITERLLNITGGDPVNINRKFKTDLEDFKLSCRFTLFSNLLPRLRDASAVFVNRCIFLAMPNSYLGREDRDLQGRLLAEMSGILNWAIDGRAMLDAAGKITQPVSGLSLLVELQSILSPVSMFLADCCNVGTDKKVEIKSLFSQWCEWCQENEVSHTSDIQSFGRKIKAILPGLGSGRARDKGGNVSPHRSYIGIELKTVSELKERRIAQSFPSEEQTEEQSSEADEWNTQ